MNMIVAVNPHGIIGKNNKLLWCIPEDMKHFRRMTMHTIVVMGRKTFESLPNGPLETRINVVITSHPERYHTRHYHQTTIFCNLDDCEDILQKMHVNTNKRVFIIGGADIYNHFFKRCKTIYVTLVQTEEQIGVSIYPLLQEMQTTYSVVSRTPQDVIQTSTIDFEFIVYESPHIVP